jgi:hypothetical protein
MRRIFTTIIVVLFTTLWVQAQATYADFTVTGCTGGVSTEHFHGGTQSYKTLGGGTANPELKITINNIPDWKTITKVSLWIFTTASWDNGQVAVNSAVPGWKSQSFSATSNAWVNVIYDFSATPFDAGNSWGQFLVQSYNQSADLYYDQITFYNAAGTVVYEIDASDVSSAPTSISLVPSDNSAIVGKALPLTVSVVPSNAGSGCDFTSSDPTIATVDGLGVVTTLAAGTTTITATSKLDALVTSAATVTVTAPDATNSLVFANFENGLGNYEGAWASWVSGAAGPIPTVEVVDNPTIGEGNLTAKALKVSNCWQYAAVAFKAFDVNKINQIKFKVYSETAISDLRFELGLNNGSSSTVNTAATALSAATWTEYTLNVSTIQSADRQFYIKLSSPGSATAAYTLYVDDIQMIAGTDFVAVTSFTVDGTGAVSVITTDNGTLQMEAKDYLPAGATNKNVTWVIPGTNVNDIATITSDGLLTAVRNGTITVRAIADGDGVFTEKEITISNQKTDFSSVSAVAKKLDAPNISSVEDFSVNVQMSYDADSIYMVFDVKDDSIVNTGANNYTIDNIEIYFDMNNSKNPLWPRGAGWPNTSFVAGDYQLRLVPDKAWSANNSLKGVNQVYTKVTGGYQFVVNIPLDSLSKDFVPAVGTKIGFDVLASDNDNSPNYRDQLSWNSPSTMLWNDPSYWGTIEFSDGGTFNVIYDTENPTDPSNVVATTTLKNATMTWDAATDNIVVQNYIVKNGTTAVDTIPALKTANKFTFTNLAIGKHTFSVIAEDIYGNKSGEIASNEVNVVVWTSFAVAKKLDAPNITSAADFTTNVKVRWDADSIYMIFDVKDDSIVNAGANNYSIDNIEIYFDMANSKNPLWPRGAGWPNTSFVAGDYQLRLVPDKAWSANNSLKGVNQVYAKVAGGYQFVVNIPIDSLSKDFVPAVGTKIGFDVLASDNDNNPNYRDQLSWNASSTMIWNDPSYWGTIEFAVDGTFITVADLVAPSVPANVLATVNVKNVVLTWDASTDNIVVQNYIIRQGTTPLDTIPAKASANTYTVSNLAVGNYTFSVIAMDLYNNKSAEGTSNAVDIVTSVISNVSASMTFSPNPVADILSISCSEIINNVAIYNTSGKLVHFANVNASRSDLKFAAFNSGVYFVKVQTVSGVQTQKIVKK